MTTYTWTGSLSTTWGDAGNWSPSGGPPGLADTAIIPSSSATSFSPVLSTSISLSVLTVQTGGTLTVGSGATLTVAHQLSVGANNLVINGTLADALSVQLAGGNISGTGGVSNVTSIDGYGAVANNIVGGSYIADGGTLILSGLVNNSGVAAQLLIFGGSTLELTNSGAVGNGSTVPTLAFFGGGGTFIDTATAMTNVHLGTISSFRVGDKIELKSFGSGDTWSVSGNTLTIQNADSTLSQTFTFQTGTSMSDIQLSDSGGVDTLTICFMAGTLIRTPDGEVPVETLKRGDLVLTTDGVAKEVVWLGKQTVSAHFADPVRSWPIRVRAGALHDNVPSRDLLVSPDHALLVDGVLIHARALVNGASIVRETVVPRSFIYYHVELDDHSLIFAENTPAETFVDNVDRMNFDNWAEYEALYPEGKSIQELPYPRAKSRRQTPAHIHAALAQRARITGVAEAAVA